MRRISERHHWLKICLSAFAVIGICFWFTTVHTTDFPIFAMDSNSMPASEKRVRVFGHVTDIDGKGLICSLEFNGNRKSRIQTDILGHFSIELPLGDYDVVISKGPFYERKNVNLSVKDRLPKDMGSQVLTKLFEFPGIYIGDLHQHSEYSDGFNSVSEILLSDIANGLNFAVLTDHNDVTGQEEWNSALNLIEDWPFIPIMGIEITTKNGHFNAYDVSRTIPYDEGDHEDAIMSLIRDMNSSNTLIQSNHPFLENEMGLKYKDLLKNFDLIEIWNGKGIPDRNENLKAKEAWFRLLNDGVTIFATGGSDNHDISGGYWYSRSDDSVESIEWQNRGLYSGQPSVAVYSKAFSKDEILKSLKNGNSFITNGPLVDFRINGKIPGETISISDNTYELTLELSDNRGLSKCVIIHNGSILKEYDFGEAEHTFTSDSSSSRSNGTYDNDSAEIVEEVRLEKGWYLIELFSKNGGYAITNPIFVK